MASSSCVIMFRNDISLLPSSLVKESLDCSRSWFISQEIFFLIEDLELVPLNYEARDFYQFYENECAALSDEAEFRLAFQRRNHSRPHVSTSDIGTLF